MIYQSLFIVATIAGMYIGRFYFNKYNSLLDSFTEYKIVQEKKFNNMRDILLTEERVVLGEAGYSTDEGEYKFV